MAGDKFLEIQLNDEERQIVGILLRERNAFLIETTEDTTRPDAERRAASVKSLAIASILEKLRLRDLLSARAADLSRTL